MADKYLSTDPAAGQKVADAFQTPEYLSMSASPEQQSNVAPEASMAAGEARIGAAPEDRPVTLSDLKDDPMAAIKRIGAIVKKDVTDPGLWMSVAAAYFGPKAFNRVAPVVARTASGAMSVAKQIPAADYVGMVSPRAGKAIEVAQQVRAAVRQAPASTPAPKMAFTAADVTRLKELISDGVSQGDAVRRVWNAKVQGGKP